MLIDLLRHGETATGNRFCGSTETELTAAGLAQLQNVSSKLPRFDAIATSPKRRCSISAQDLASRFDCPLHTLSNLQELDFGAWEGRLVADIALEQENALADFWRDPVQYSPPGGEAFADFERRVVSALHYLYMKYPQQHVLVVTHGGPIRYLLCKARSLAVSELLNLSVPYASRFRLRIDHDKQNGWTLNELPCQ